MKALGAITHMDLDLQEPINMRFDGDVNKIMILVGQNASGKTLVLKTQWFMQMAMNYMIATDDEAHRPQYMQWLFENTFEKPEQFSGSTKATWGDFYLMLHFKKGEITSIEGALHNEIALTNPIFMSKSIRTFDDQRRYMKIRKKFSPKMNIVLADDEARGMLEFYKLYDILYMEAMVRHFAKGQRPSRLFNEHLSKFDVEPITELKLSLEDGEMYNQAQPMTSMSAGQQSIVNMTIGSFNFNVE